VVASRASDSKRSGLLVAAVCAIPPPNERPTTCPLETQRVEHADLAAVSSIVNGCGEPAAEP
jgi:hypothetical protein